MEIIEHRVALEGEQAVEVLHPALVARIAGRDSAGAEPFGKSMGAVMRSGLIVLADSLTSEVFLFDSTGHLIRRIGQAGDGPADYKRLGRLFLLAADSLAVTDQKGVRMTVLRPDASVARIGEIRGIPWDGELLAGTESVPGFSMILGRLPGGGYLAMQRLVDLAEPAALKIGYPAERIGKGWLLRLDSAGGGAVRIGELRLEAVVFHAYKGGLSFSPLLFSIPESVAGTGDQYWRTDGKRFHVDQHSLAGGLQRSIRLCREHRALTDADVRRAWEKWTATLQSPTWEFESGTPAPRTLPSWRIQSFAPDGQLWLEEQGAPDAPRQWWVFGTDGRLLGIVQLPADRAVYSIGNGRILTVVAAGEDDERVEIFAIPGELSVTLLSNARLLRTAAQ